ncbi:MAG: hypothetical protein GDA38_14660 [Hormoscilla sp. SP12CHS1]|nr:hypothetical protein [Hormoscilla sp. SP12CHS1]
MHPQNAAILLRSRCANVARAKQTELLILACQTGDRYPQKNGDRPIERLSLINFGRVYSHF